MKGGTTVVVLGRGIFDAGGPIGKFFPMLEMGPLVDDRTCIGECPPIIETIGGVEIDGES